MNGSAVPQAAATTVTAIGVTPSATLTFETFYAQSCGPVAKALAATLNDADLAADAVNEAMVRAYQRWPKVSAYDNPGGWVYRVALNWALSWKQCRRRETDRPVRLGPDRHEMSLPDDRFKQVLGRLSVEHRSVIACRVYLDWSVEQTSVALKIAPGTVKSRLARALAQVREELAETDQAPTNQATTDQGPTDQGTMSEETVSENG